MQFLCEPEEVHPPVTDTEALDDWETSFALSEQEITQAPAILQRTSASCIHGAVEEASPSFSAAALSAWAEAEPARVGVLSDCPDNLGANKRNKKAVAASLPPNVLYDVYTGCCVHRLHGFVTKVIGEDKVVGHVHACQFVLNFL